MLHAHGRGTISKKVDGSASAEMYVYDKADGDKAIGDIVHIMVLMRRGS